MINDCDDILAIIGSDKKITSSKIDLFDYQLYN